MAEFGTFLKQAREDRGVTLRQIATTTKISMVALEALERGDFARLPGGIFSRAFVRAYALEVGLEPEQTVATFIEEYDKAASMRAERIIRPEVTADDRDFLERQHRAARMLRWVLIGVALIAVGALILWQWRARSQPDGAPSVSAPVSESAPPQTASAAPPASDRAPMATQGEAPSGAPAGAPLPSSPLATAPTVAAPVTVQTTPVDPDRVALHVDVTEDCWIRVKVDGVVMFAQVMHAGDQRDVKPGREVVLDVGNAGAVRWTVNGQPARSLGRTGQTGSARLTKATIGQYVQVGKVRSFQVPTPNLEVRTLKLELRS